MATRKGITWCWEEPLVRINGEEISIEPGVLASLEDARRFVTSAETRIIVPPGTEYETLMVEMEPFEEVVTYVIDPAATDIRMEIRFKALTELTAGVKVNGEVVATGTTSDVLTYRQPIAQLV